MIKHLFKHMPQWALAIGFLLFMMFLQIVQDMDDWYRGTKEF